MSSHTPDGGWADEDLEEVGACPICLSSESSLFADGLCDLTPSATPGTWRMRRCSRCASLFLSPRPTPGSIGRAYDSPEYGPHTPAVLRDDRRRMKRPRVRLRNGYLNSRHGYSAVPASRLGAALFRAYPPLAMGSDAWIRHLSHPGGSPRLLDVGCGNGGLVAHLGDLGWRVEGIDPDPHAVALAGAAGVAARLGTLAELREELEPGYDAITLSHSVEHLHDPRETLGVARGLLRPGGVIWIATPNAGSIGLRVFGRDWRGLEPPRHLAVPSAEGLRRLLEEVGFEAIRAPVRTSGAGWYFAASRAVARRRDPHANPALAARFGALPAGAIGWLRPDLREECNLIAHRPRGS